MVVINVSLIVYLMNFWEYSYFPKFIVIIE